MKPWLKAVAFTVVLLSAIFGFGALLVVAPGWVIIGALFIGIVIFTRYSLY